MAKIVLRPRFSVKSNDFERREGTFHEEGQYRLLVTLDGVLHNGGVCDQRIIDIEAQEGCKHKKGEDANERL